MQENHSPARIEEIKKRMQDAGIEPINIAFEDIRRNMSDEEKDELDGEIREHVFEHNRIEEKKKEVTKALKDQMDKELDLLRAKSELREKGYHDVNTKCIFGIDKTRGVVSIVDITTGLEVATRMIKDSDLQTTMPIEHEQPKEQAPTTPEAIGIGFEGNRGDGPIEVEGAVVEDDQPLIESEEQTTGEELSMVDMIGAVTEKGAWWIIETPKHTFYTEDETLAEIAKDVMERRLYADIGYIDEPEARNKRMTSLKPREINEESVDLELPEGFVDTSNTDIP